MRLLLDTHVALWLTYDPKSISGRAMSVVSDQSNEVLLSAVSAFEIATKVRIGKLAAGEMVDDWSSVLVRLRATPLPLSTEHALLAGTLAGSHRDPFDRMLAAQAILEGLILVSSDTALDSLGIQRFW